MSLVFLKIRAGQENERGPLYMESMIAALHSLRNREGITSLQIGVGPDRKIALFVRTSADTVAVSYTHLTLPTILRV